MKVLLDTHVLIWALANSARLSQAARTLLGDTANGFLVSAVSAMEVTTKFRLGKLPEARFLAEDFAATIQRLEAIPLPISLAHAALAGGLNIDHRDPFDRLLIAQARIEDVPIVSNERCFDTFGVQRIW